MLTLPGMNSHFNRVWNRYVIYKDTLGNNGLELPTLDHIFTSAAFWRMTASPVTTPPPLYCRALRAHTMDSNKKMIKAIADVLVLLESVAYPEKELFPLWKKKSVQYSICRHPVGDISIAVQMTSESPEWFPGKFWSVFRSVISMCIYAFMSTRKAGDNDIPERCESHQIMSICVSWRCVKLWVQRRSVMTQIPLTQYLCLMSLPLRLSFGFGEDKSIVRTWKSWVKTFYNTRAHSMCVCMTF